MASGTKFALNKLYRECSPACLEKTYSLKVNFSSSKMSFYHCDLCIHNLSGKTTYLERTCLLDIGVGLSRQVSLYSNFECFSLLNHVQSVHDFLWPLFFTDNTAKWECTDLILPLIVIISSALPLAGGAYPVRGDDVGVLAVVVVRRLLLQIATPPKLLARSFSNFTQ